MKAFELPRMEVVHLMKEDIVRTSCRGFSCSSFQCDECAECQGTYNCWIFNCFDPYDHAISG